MNLEAKGYRVGTAYDGIEAQESIQADKPDMIVLDVMMPRKNGYELCNELKSDPQYKDVPILMLTAVGSAVGSTTYTHQDGMQLEADDYLPKPVDMDRLVALVDELMP
jgi:DNA-binding response OmpR family regulator